MTNKFHKTLSYTLIFDQYTNTDKIYVNFELCNI